MLISEALRSALTNPDYRSFTNICFRIRFFSTKHSPRSITIRITAAAATIITTTIAMVSMATKVRLDSVYYTTTITTITTNRNNFTVIISMYKFTVIMYR